jgi:hypothetical protein
MNIRLPPQTMKVGYLPYHPIGTGYLNGVQWVVWEHLIHQSDRFAFSSSWLPSYFAPFCRFVMYN